MTPLNRAQISAMALCAALGMAEAPQRERQRARNFSADEREEYNRKSEAQRQAKKRERQSKKRNRR